MKICVRVSAIAALVTLIACGAHTATNAGDGATATTGADAKTTIVKTAAGSETLGGAVDPQMLGVAIYPGAVYDGDTQISTATKTGAGTVAMFETVDAFSKVDAFYKSRLPAGAEKVNMTLEDGSMAEFQAGDQTTKRMTIVTIRTKNGRTQILISTTTRL